MADDVYDYVVVGSGAGGGTVAARLAEAGRSVLMLEAGGDPRLLQGGNALRRGNCLPEDYDVPAFHPCATENEAIAWDYFVRHYGNDAQQKLDSKFSVDGGRTGILYPRAAALGGCTAHNAMILVCPDNEDWDAIARDTGDPSWSAANMRALFRRLEQCRHRPIQRLFGDWSLTRHGWNGWLRGRLGAAAGLGFLPRRSAMRPLGGRRGRRLCEQRRAARRDTALVAQAQRARFAVLRAARQLPRLRACVFSRARRSARLSDMRSVSTLSFPKQTRTNTWRPFVDALTWMLARMAVGYGTPTVAGDILGRLGRHMVDHSEQQRAQDGASRARDAGGLH